MNRPASHKWKQKKAILCCKQINGDYNSWGQQAGEGSQEDDFPGLGEHLSSMDNGVCTAAQQSGCSNCALSPLNVGRKQLHHTQEHAPTTVRVDPGIIDLEEICSSCSINVDGNIAPEPPVLRPEVISRRSSSGKQSSRGSIGSSSGKRMDPAERKEWKRIQRGPSIAAKYAAKVDMAATPEDVQREILCRQERRKIKHGAVYFTMCEVKRHVTRNSCWLVAGKNVYDVTRFLDMHPAGDQTMLRAAGGIDCTRDFNFHSHAAQQMLEQFYIGMLRKCPVCDRGGDCLLS
jgi:cytochrome b involved in lipid metabolism